MATWLLSRAGTDVHAVNHGGSTALHSAAANDRAALVELLLEHGAAAAGVKDANGDTPFGAAALREHGEGTTQKRENRCGLESPLISPRPNDGRATNPKTKEFSDLGKVKLPYPYGFSPR